MGRLKFYAEHELDPETTAKAMAFELHISPKHAREICRAVKGRKVEDAEAYLEHVLNMKEAVPFKRFKKKVAHRRGLKKWYAGRYPTKATSVILKLIRGAKSNAEYKGLDPEALRIWRAVTKKGRTIRGIMPRAFGRATSRDIETVTVEIVLKEERG